MKRDVIVVNPYAIQLFQSSICLVERSDTSHGTYPRATFMTVFALHPQSGCYPRAATIKTMAINR